MSSVLLSLPAPSLSMTVEAKVFDGRGVEDDSYHLTVRGYGGVLFSGYVDGVAYAMYQRFFGHSDRMTRIVTRLDLDAWA